MAEAERHAQRVTWPGTLGSLALARAELARWSGDAGAASAAVAGGLRDFRCLLDITQVERVARSRLGDAGFAEAAREGQETGWEELVAVTLAS